MAPVLGRPLLHYALTSALQAHLPARVVVSSDDKAILEFASGYGENIALPRPADLAADLTPSQPVLQHALEVCEAQDGIRYESIVLVQPTNPLVSPQDIDATITTGHI